MEGGEHPCRCPGAEGHPRRPERRGWGVVAAASTLGFRLSFFGVTLSCCGCSLQGQLMVTLMLSTFCCRSTTICGSDTLHTGRKRPRHQASQEAARGRALLSGKGHGNAHRLTKTFPMQPVRLLRAPGSGEPPSQKSGRPPCRRCRRLDPMPAAASCSSSSTYSRTLHGMSSLD